MVATKKVKLEITLLKCFLSTFSDDTPYAGKCRLAWYVILYSFKAKLYLLHTNAEIFISSRFSSVWDNLCRRHTE